MGLGSFLRAGFRVGFGKVLRSRRKKVVTKYGHKDPLKCGFLFKQGGLVKNWKKRWFVLRGKELVYYKDMRARQPLGVIVLKKKNVHGPAEKMSCFDKRHRVIVIPGDSRTYYLSASCDSEADDWISAINEVLYGPPKEAPSASVMPTPLPQQQQQPVQYMGGPPQYPYAYPAHQQVYPTSSPAPAPPPPPGNTANAVPLSPYPPPPPPAAYPLPVPPPSYHQVVEVSSPAPSSPPVSSPKGGEEVTEVKGGNFLRHTTEVEKVTVPHVRNETFLR